ncbi:hypothetical protein FLO80_17265 [Aquicoccus porphyridii]|uniref:Uncharacterized protein n=1 Tax=Aquicoccus porphyridii TaxID=1852029 RepID=A0A5A9Z4N4_9RHOB|nr:hypothetical protein [Aquicoccus porphyridii]KAA0912153.1 hypothetical protein FLO80_17265 [Aquicoccus porphyridii]RAI52994.1 hypothetical protein DOO74_13950 [Rhodobacteraceae bacterium AsT-22]
MINPFAAGFLAIAVLVGAGVDYHQQSVRAEVPLGTLGLADYAQTVTERFSQMRAGNPEESTDNAPEVAVAEGPEEAGVPESSAVEQPGEADGVMRKLGGLFNGDSAGTGGTAGPAGQGEATVVQRSGQGRAGFGSGKCSYEGAIKRCTVGN